MSNVAKNNMFFCSLKFKSGYFLSQWINLWVLQTDIQNLLILQKFLISIEMKLIALKVGVE